MTTAEFSTFIELLKSVFPQAPQFDGAQLNAWYSFFEHIPSVDAFAVLREVPKHCDRFPSIKQLLDLMDPKPDTDAEARNVADRIYAGIARWGSMRGKQDAIREYVGPIGWRVVEQNGGWHVLCEICTYENAPTLKAQWRESAKALIEIDNVNARRERQGLPAYQKPESMPEPSSRPALDAPREGFDLAKVIGTIKTRSVS